MGLRQKGDGFGFVEFNGKWLNFTIFEDGSGHCEVNCAGKQLYVDESGSHEDRIKKLQKEALKLKKISILLDKAANKMKEYKYDIPK